MLNFRETVGFYSVGTRERLATPLADGRERGMTGIIRRFARSEAGATAVEYAVMCMCLVLVIIVSISNLGTQLNSVYTEVTAAIK